MRQQAIRPRSVPDRLAAARPCSDRMPAGGVGMSVGIAVMSGFEVRRSTHGELSVLTESLIAEFTAQLPAGTVIGCVGHAREQLLSSGVRAGLVVAVESMARTRLRTMHPVRRAAS
jgi:hypothetical protein